jgi:hypothetical protein
MKLQHAMRIALWEAVMTRAGFRCQCHGGCGQKHAKDGGRCPITDGAYIKGRGWVRLGAVPQDPALQLAQASRLPVESLKAACPKCYDGIARRAKAGREAKNATATQAHTAPLFDL